MATISGVDAPAEVGEDATGPGLRRIPLAGHFRGASARERDVAVDGCRVDFASRTQSTDWGIPARGIAVVGNGRTGGRLTRDLSDRIWGGVRG